MRMQNRSVRYKKSRPPSGAALSFELVRTAPSRPFFCGREAISFSTRQTIRQRAWTGINRFPRRERRSQIYRTAYCTRPLQTRGEGL